ncbi:hypothetical protein NDU88_003242 [Pleurodeles waltl]|uniref:Uncharacterized protein n=1 Tax=Pleurodeles waltl TaxID=8319 RepID=A0AAV7SDZ1_PLEWA|nr:hypothetical protein NDU88_003242 [Pleurodeles waltl]
MAATLSTALAASCSSTRREEEMIMMMMETAPESRNATGTTASVKEMIWKVEMAHGNRTASKHTRGQKRRPEAVKRWGPGARTILESVAGVAAERRCESVLRGPVERTASAVLGRPLLSPA